MGSLSNAKRHTKLKEMIVEILVFVTCWYRVALGELLPGTATGYTTLPGYGYAGDTQTRVDLLLGGEIGEQLCSSRCSLAEECQAFFMEGSTCNIVEDPSNIQKLGGQNFYVKTTTGPLPAKEAATNADAT